MCWNSRKDGLHHIIMIPRAAHGTEFDQLGWRASNEYIYRNIDQGFLSEGNSILHFDLRCSCTVQYKTVSTVDIKFKSITHPHPYTTENEPLSDYYLISRMINIVRHTFITELINVLQLRCTGEGHFSIVTLCIEWTPLHLYSTVWTYHSTGQVYE